MSIFCFSSASGSPGVSTAVLGMALCWPRPVVLVEADPTGGSSVLAGFMQAREARVGLVELTMAHQQRLLVEALPRLLSTLPGSEVRVLPAVRAHVQAGAVATVWPSLVEALRDLAVRDGADVLVDAGRLGLAGWPESFVTGSDASLLVTGSGLPELAAARSWASWLGEVDGPSAVGVVLAGPGRPYGAKEVAATLGLPVVGSLPRDEASARVWSHGATQPRRFQRAGLVSAVAELGRRVRALLPHDHSGSPDQPVVEVVSA